eukprot:gene8461-11441_t
MNLDMVDCILSAARMTDDISLDSPVFIPKKINVSPERHEKNIIEDLGNIVETYNPKSVVECRKLHKLRLTQVESGMILSDVTPLQGGYSTIQVDQYKCDHIRKINNHDGKNVFQVIICGNCCEQKVELNLGLYADEESALLVNDCYEMITFNRSDKLNLLRAEDEDYIFDLYIDSYSELDQQQFFVVSVLDHLKSFGICKSYENKKRKSPTSHNAISQKSKQEHDSNLIPVNLISDDFIGNVSIKSVVTSPSTRTAVSNTDDETSLVVNNLDGVSKQQSDNRIISNLELLADISHHSGITEIESSSELSFDNSHSKTKHDVDVILSAYNPNQRIPESKDELDINFIKPKVSRSNPRQSIITTRQRAATFSEPSNSSFNDVSYFSTFSRFDKADQLDSYNSYCLSDKTPIATLTWLASMEDDEVDVAKSLSELSSMICGGEKSSEERNTYIPFASNNKTSKGDFTDGTMNGNEHEILKMEHTVVNKSRMRSNSMPTLLKHNSSDNENQTHAIIGLSVSHRSKSDPLSIVLKKFHERGGQKGVGYIGIYSPEDRKTRVQRFIDKRKFRMWTKKVKYDVRKNFADSRVRVKGRFVKKDEEISLKSSHQRANSISKDDDEDDGEYDE